MAVIDDRAAIEVDPEVKGRVLDFIRERKRVTVEDVRREFFPDEMGAPYLYLDQLAAEGHTYPISRELEPTQWLAALTPEDVAERQAALREAARERAERWSTGGPLRVRIKPTEKTRRHIPWAKISNGNTYRITDDETKALFGVNVVEFRRRFVAHCNRSGRKYRASRVVDHALTFRIEGRR
ncbi:hypothetical protein Sipo8835_32630 [Streptomyces ipomoeae]|uniref:Uncharacterized protein n=1 Tax=Streptomyces ipomoeae TaxID=103232 RepID=A0AAE8VX08_9ACTN|nr:hypothetical protein [Streptomyces ipomoeae]TQE24861.1 hypothetical protein Sipo8835_32630 [Streptomyces ipomoeae]